MSAEKKRADDAIGLMKQCDPEGMVSRPHYCVWSDLLSHSTRDVLALEAELAAVREERDADKRALKLSDEDRDIERETWERELAAAEAALAAAQREIEELRDQYEPDT